MEFEERCLRTEFLSAWKWTNNFSNSILINGNFKNTILTQTDFNKSDLTNVDFSNSNLEDAIGGPFIGCMNHHLCE